MEIKYTNDKGGTYAAQTTKFSLDAAGGTPQTLTFSAPAGLFLDKTFWAVFTWVDSRGAQEVNSGKAVFTVR